MTFPLAKNRLRSGVFFALWTAAIVCPALAAGSDATLVVGAEADETTLALKGSPAFHATSNKIIAPWLIGIPNSAGVAAVWSEIRPNGDTADFYAVSLDGQTFSRVRETSYRIKLRYVDFDPALDEPIVPDRLQANPSSKLYFVQFATQPLEAYRQELRNRGATVWTFLANHAHIVRMTPEVRGVVEQLPFVRWVGRMHTAYKLEEEIIEQIETGQEIAPRRYSVMMYERGVAAQDRVSAHINTLGGVVHGTVPESYRLEATLSLEQVLSTAALDDVMFIDRKGELEHDMNIARQLGGADFIEQMTGFIGQGVRAEVADTEVDVNHPEWAGRPPIIHRAGSSGLHGTAVYSILFAQGVRPNARGLIPEGVGIFANSIGLLGGGQTRFGHTAELVDPNGPYRAVFQTNSTGDPRTTQYTTISAEMDDMLLMFDIVICQSQSNAGGGGTPRNSRPQAWAKNIVSGGAVNHLNTADRSDDRWLNPTGTSTGPAADGRVKPTLAGFYDNIEAAWSGGGYTQFGGTSGGTPIVAGHTGLVMQMWHEGVFAGFGGGATVFDSRPHMTTVKALLVNTAFRYDWNAGGQNASLDRFKQGWGWPDIRELYENRDNIFIVDEGNVITELMTITHRIDVAPGETHLRATMVYADTRGNVGAGQHRINDLSMRVTSPSGTVYWGNNGLTSDNFSTVGGVSNTIDTVENVFVENPEPGQWIVDVIADEINEDSHAETPEVDADYALVVTGGVGTTVPPPFRIRVISKPAGLHPPGSVADAQLAIVPGLENIVPGSEVMFYRYDNGPFVIVPLVDLGGELYTGSFPDVRCGDTPEFYFQAEGDQGTVLTAPGDAPATVFDFSVGVVTELYRFDFETSPGWTTEILGASSGFWERGVPVNDPNWAYDPISDSDGSGRCWLTENQFGNTDVDGGAVRLTSSLFDLSGGNVDISYDYFLRLNNTTGGVDRLLVEISSNDMAGPWIEIARHTNDGGLNWQNHVVTQADLDAAGVTMTATMRIRWTANDADPQSINEAGLDALLISSLGCEPAFPPGDLNCDGTLNGGDIDPFFLALGDPAGYEAAFPDCDILLGDMNGDGSVNGGDIDPFFACLGGGVCP